MAKESLAKVWESTTKAMSTTKIMITAKTVRKEKERRMKGKGKGQGKDEKPGPNSSFQGYCRTCGKWRHEASEC